MALGPNLTKTSGRAQSFLSFTLCKTEQDCIQGDFVECGVWAGGNIIIARKTNPNILCWAFDTFSGMTKPTAKDKKRGGSPAMFSYLAKGAKGWSSKSVIEVRKNLWDSGVLDEDKIRFIEDIKLYHGLDDPTDLMGTVSATHTRQFLKTNRNDQSSTMIVIRPC